MSIHCATCRCASTLTGRIAMLLDGEPVVEWSVTALMWLLSYDGAQSSLQSTLDRMAKDGKIRRVRCFYRSAATA